MDTVGGPRINDERRVLGGSNRGVVRLHEDREGVMARRGDPNVKRDSFGRCWGSTEEAIEAFNH
jgi:hypothetical protein